MAILTAIVLTYLVMVATFVVGYHRIAERRPTPHLPCQFISIVACCRNEEQNIANLLESIRTTGYPPESYEVVAVNDHSTDNTLQVLQMLLPQFKNYRIVNLDMEVEGKKAALQAGVHASMGSIIAITDADCLVPQHWLTNISSIMSRNVDLICGPVAYHPTTFFEKIASVEFASLVASGIGSAGVGRPIFCNGANMSFRKELLTEANLHQGQTPSGDDVFILHHAKQQHHNIRFTTGIDNLVTTTADKNLTEFINRRKRWGSKAKHYNDKQAMLVAIVVFTANLALLAAVALAVTNHSYTAVAIGLVAAKAIADYLLLAAHFRANGISKWAKYFILCVALYPIYITFTAIASTTTKFTWKQRRYNDPKASRPGHSRGES